MTNHQPESSAGRKLPISWKQEDIIVLFLLGADERIIERIKIEFFNKNYCAIDDIYMECVKQGKKIYDKKMEKRRTP